MFTVQAESFKSLETKEEVFSTMDNRVKHMEDMSRTATLRVTDVEELQGERIEEVMLQVKRISTDKLLLPSVKVLYAHRVR